MDEQESRRPTGERANVAIVRQAYAAMTARDMPAVFSLLAPDVVIEQSTEVPWGGTYEGHEGVMRFFATLVGTITSTLVFERFVDAGDSVVAIARTQGTVNGTDARYDVPVAHVWTIEDGRVVRIRFYIDNPTMLAALSQRAC